MKCMPDSVSDRKPLPKLKISFGFDKGLSLTNLNVT